MRDAGTTTLDNINIGGVHFNIVRTNQNFPENKGTVLISATIMSTPFTSANPVDPQKQALAEKIFADFRAQLPGYTTASEPEHSSNSIKELWIRGPRKEEQVRSWYGVKKTVSTVQDVNTTYKEVLKVAMDLSDHYLTQYPSNDGSAVHAALKKTPYTQTIKTARNTRLEVAAIVKSKISAASATVIDGIAFDTTQIIHDGGEDWKSKGYAEAEGATITAFTREIEKAVIKSLDDSGVGIGAKKNDGATILLTAPDREELIAKLTSYAMNKIKGQNPQPGGIGS